MQKKYLALALSSALAMALTGCGSDNDSSYNKNPAIEPGTGNTTTTPGTGNTTPGTDNTTPEAGKDKPESGEVKPDPNKPDPNKPTPKPDPKPEGSPDPENNPGQAANPGNPETKNIIVAQNYLRGKDTSFDKPNNPKNVGNATVLGYNELNPSLSNIVLAQVELDKKNDGKNTLNIYTGEYAQNVPDNVINSNAKLGDDGINLKVGKDDSLQAENDTVFNKNFRNGDAAKELTEYLSSNDGLNKVNQSILANKSDTNTLSSIGKEAYKHGLVRVAKIGDPRQTASWDPVKDTAFFVAGQEDQIITTNKNTKVVTIVHDTGADVSSSSRDNDVRIFGSLSNIKDIPKYKFDSVKNKFVLNNPAFDNSVKDQDFVLGSNAKGTQNSYQMYDTVYNAVILPDLKKAKEKAVKAATTDADKKIAAAIYDNGAEKLTLSPLPLHLNHVQYGRVTVNVEDSEFARLEQAVKDKNRLFHFNSASKYRLENGVTEGSQPDNFNIDYYYARGVQPTTEMPKEGNIKYLGHALTYGLDNTFHGGQGHQGDANTVEVNSKEGIGNFVAAEVDFGKKEVKGMIYNVWRKSTDSAYAGVVNDPLVTFSGSLNDKTNSAIGTAERTYAKGEGAFKGSFFGPGAEELAGSVNSVKSGYGSDNWGGVFGAQKFVPDTKATFDVTNSVEQHN